MTNNHLRRPATCSTTITLIIMVVILTSALPSFSMEGSGVLASTNEQFTNLASSSRSGRDPAKSKLLTLHSSIEADQQRQDTGSSSEIQESTMGPYPLPEIARRITESNAAYLASAATITRAARQGGTYGT